jgi:hypothetical protein
METFTTFIVQAWIEGYEYWSNTSEPTEGMFTIPKLGYDTEDQGRARLRELQAAYPAARYRLVRQVTTTEEI